MYTYVHTHIYTQIYTCIYRYLCIIVVYIINLLFNYCVTINAIHVIHADILTKMNVKIKHNILESFIKCYIIHIYE